MSALLEPKIETTATANVSRRSFIQVVGGFGASLVLGSFFSLGCGPADRPEDPIPGTSGSKKPTSGKSAFEPNGYLKVDPDGTITVTIVRSDMGQGVRTSLAMLVAEEMDADWHKVKVIQAPGGTSDPSGQGTGGSSSIRTSFTDFRQIGASARAMLVAAAAKQWNVDPSTCTTKNGMVLHGSHSLAYADLTGAAAAMPIPDNKSIKLKEASEFTIVGKPTTRVDNPAVVTGKALFGIDVKVEGMKYAVIARPPKFGASMKSFDDTAAKAVPGVSQVFKMDNGVVVVADNTWTAMKGRDALKIDWDDGPNGALSTESIRQLLTANVIDHPAMPDGAKVIKATFDLPYLAHATMEPMNAVADVRDGSCEIWCGTQVPDGAQQTAANAVGLSSDHVKVNVMLLGGGFGRRLLTDFVAEAAKISQQAKCPIKLLWTREDDMKHDHYRPMTHQSLVGAVDATGSPVGWSHQIVTAEGRRGAAEFGNAGLSYKIPGAMMRQAGASTPVPTSAWRSVENTWINVVNECFMDEMAHAAGADPYEFRRKLIADERLGHVLEQVAEKSGWSSKLPDGTGRGIACFRGYGSYVAHVVELTVKGDHIKLNHVYAVVDVGLAVNPKGVEAQVQGGCSDGCSTALRAAITIDKGAVVENSWDDYNWMTMDSTPPIDVTVLQTSGQPGGMGEVGYPSVAPAVANAVFAATGKRVRKFPIVVSELE